MTVNFDIKENYALAYNGRHLDLHNCFDFESVEYNIKSHKLTLSWVKSLGDWVDKDELNSIVITHINVDYLEISNTEESPDNREDDCLSEITYFSSKDREINDCFMMHNQPKEDDDILYYFQSGLYVRVHCEQIEAVCC